MNTTILTERDKKLLHVLAFIVIIFVFAWFLIRPLCNRIIETHESIQEADALRVSNETKLIGLESTHTSTDKFNSDLAKSTDMYYDYMDSSEIDKLVTSYILSKGLNARDLTIRMPEGYVEEKPYQHSQAALQLENTSDFEASANEAATNSASANTSDTEENNRAGKLKDAILAYITGYESHQLVTIPNATEEYVNSLSGIPSTASSGINCVELQITIDGDEEIEQQVIDELSKNPSLRITSFRWGHLDPVTYLLEDGTILIYENDDTQLTISVNLYMKDRTEDQ